MVSLEFPFNPTKGVPFDFHLTSKKKQGRTPSLRKKKRRKKSLPPNPKFCGVTPRSAMQLGRCKAHHAHQSIEAGPPGDLLLRGKNDAPRAKRPRFQTRRPPEKANQKPKPKMKGKRRFPAEKAPTPLHQTKHEDILRKTATRGCCCGKGWQRSGSLFTSVFCVLLLHLCKAPS